MIIPVRFIYLEDGEKVYASLIGQFKHHFTDKTVYRIRLEGESGWFAEYLYLEEVVANLLKKRIDE